MTDLRSSLTSYLQSRGWKAAEVSGEHGEVWHRRSSELAVPVPREFSDGGPEWELVLDRLARVEGVERGPLEQRIRIQGPSFYFIAVL